MLQPAYRAETQTETGGTGMSAWARAGAVLLTLAALTTGADGQVRLSFQGQPYFDGAMKLSLEAPAHVGQTPLFAFGLDPLLTPLPSEYGPWHVGLLLGVVAMPPIAADGLMQFGFAMPSEDPSSLGVPLVVQGWVPVGASGLLSNPATLAMAWPNHLPGEALTYSSPNAMLQGNFGDRVAAGDLDDDGHMDLVVGARTEDFAGHDRAGRAYVFWGPDFVSSTTLDPQQPQAWGAFGTGLLVADLDGDGVDDLVVAESSGDFAPGTGGPPAWLHFYYGGPGFSASPVVSLPSAGAGYEVVTYGRELVAGDLDHDGDLDIAVGVPKATVGLLADAGRVDVLWGPDFLQRTVLTAPQPQASGGFGVNLAVGDIDGDGVDDLVESSCGTDVGGVVNIGSAHVYRGPGLQFQQVLDNPLPMGSQSCFGWQLHLGDLDGDGLDEVVVSDLRDHVFVFEAPSLLTWQVVPKPPTGTVNPFGETAYGDWLGTEDVNDDGFVDLVIGDPFDGEVGGCWPTSSGVVFAALGPFHATFQHIVDVTQACGDEFGWSFALVDLDGDGERELVTGAPTVDAPGVLNCGRVTVFELEVQAQN